MKVITILLVGLALLNVNPCFALQTMHVKTGFGYITDSNGNIIAKYNLPPGDHPLNDGCTYTEVKDEVALKAINVYVPPPTKEQEMQALIQEKQRSLAIQQLQKEGLIDDQTANSELSRLTILQKAEAKVQTKQ
jgi:hypothetical protein